MSTTEKRTRSILSKKYDSYIGTPLFDRLVASMKEFGFLPQHRIVRFRGEIIDGHHREEAAKIAEKVPLYFDLEEVVGDDEEKARQYIVVGNEVRRHLTKAAMAMRAFRANEEASVQSVQKLTGASKRDVVNARKAVQEAKNDPEMAELVDDVTSGDDAKTTSTELMRRMDGRGRHKPAGVNHCLWSVRAKTYNEMSDKAAILTGQPLEKFLRSAWKERVARLEKKGGTA